MAKTKDQKKKILEQYTEKVQDADALFVIAPTQITPNEATELRKKLKECEASFSVVKNTLIKLALEGAKKDAAHLDLGGENAIIFCKGDVGACAKVVYEYLEEVKKGSIKGGFLDGSPLVTEQVEELAKLPSKEMLIAQTVGTIAAPLTGFVNVLNGNIVNLVNVIKNISEEKTEN